MLLELSCSIIRCIWGTLAVPITNPDTTFGAQLLGVVSINAFVFVVSLIVWSVMKATMGIRLSKEAEMKGKRRTGE